MKTKEQIQKRIRFIDKVLVVCGFGDRDIALTLEAERDTLTWVLRSEK